MTIRGSIPERGSRPNLRRGSLVLVGSRNLGAQHIGCPPAPVGVVQHGASERDHIGLAFGDDRLGLLGRGDQPDRTRRDAGLALHLFGELHVRIGNQGGPRVGADAAGGNADEIDAEGLEFPAESNGIVGREPAVDPVVSGNPGAERHPADRKSVV